MTLTDRQQRIFKYLVIGMTVSIAALLISNEKLTNKESVMIGMVASSTFGFLDLYSPYVCQKN